MTTTAKQVTFVNTNNSIVETEQEAINMIKYQNKKIQELEDELEKRDQNIQTLLSQVNGLESYKFQMENFKRQTTVLEDKLKLYETDITSKANHLTDQLSLLSGSETKLRNQVISKDKVIFDLESGFKDQNIIISNLNKQLLEKDDLNNQLKQEINEILSKFRNITKRMEIKEEEFRKACEEKDLQINKYVHEKTSVEDKLTQVIDIIKQYSKELDELNGKVYHYESEYKAAKQINERQNEEIEQLIRDNNDLQENIVKYKDISYKVQDAERLIDNLESALKNERVKFDSLSRNNQDLLEKYQLLRDKIAGENNPDNLKLTVDSKVSEINKLNCGLDGLMKTVKAFELKNFELDNENRELVNHLNTDIVSLIQWIETYLGNFYDNNFNIPDISSTISKSLRAKLKFDNLKEAVINTRRRVNEEFHKILTNLGEYKRSNSEFNHKLEVLNSENHNLKLQLAEKDEDVKALRQESENYRLNINNNKESFTKLKKEFNEERDNFNNFLERIYSSIKAQHHNIYKNDSLKQISSSFQEFTFTDNLQRDIENELHSLFNIYSSVVKSYESTTLENEEAKRLKHEYERVKRELNDRIRLYNTDINKIKKESDTYIEQLEKDKFEQMKTAEASYKHLIEQLNNSLNEKEDFLMRLQQENILLKADMEVGNKTIKTTLNNQLNETIGINDRIKDSYKELEKKYKNLLTDIELKDKQIKSQEQMLLRRSQEIEENRLKNENKSSVYNSEGKAKIRALEVF
jgi:chromosome segregation ATPase